MKSVTLLHGLTYTLFESAFFIDAAPVDTKGIYQFTNGGRKEEIKSFEKVKGKGLKSKGPQKGKGSTGSSNHFQNQKKKSKGKGKTKSEGEGQRSTWSWNLNQDQSDRKGHKANNGKGKINCQVCGEARHQAHQSSRTDCTRIFSESSISELKAGVQFLNQFRHYNHINSESFKIYDPLFNNNINTSLKSHESRNYGSASSVLHHPGHVSGFSGYRLNINCFPRLTNPDAGYPMGPSLPQHLQEP